MRGRRRWRDTRAGAVAGNGVRGEACICALRQPKAIFPLRSAPPPSSIRAINNAPPS